MESLIKDKLIILVEYAIAILISCICVCFFPISSLFVRTLVADVCSTIFIYVMSIIHKNTSVYDAYWSVYPMFIVFYWFYHHFNQDPNLSWKQGVVMFLVIWWAIRLTYNWQKYWNGMEHEDWRYTRYREKGSIIFQIINLFGLQLMPTIWVFLGSLSLYPALIPASAADDGIFNIFINLIAIMVTITAIMFETIGDRQMHEFINTKKPGENIDVGLWRYTRHPNYFGEVLFWWGLWLFGIASDLTFWWTIIGPLAITLLFICISIPMMEKRNVDRRPGYKNYQEKVSMLIPWKKKKGKR